MKRKKLFGFSILATLLLSSCEWPFPIIDYNEEPSSSEAPISFDEFNEQDNQGYKNYIPSGERPTYKYLNELNGISTINSTGEQKLLVVPVEFSDYPASELDSAGGEITRQRLEKAFFGSSDDTVFESVASYYYKSSYGALNFSGEVTNWVDLGVTTSYLSEYVANNKNNPNYAGMDGSYFALEKVYEQLDAALLNEYDQDNDGEIDAIFLVYSAPNFLNSKKTLYDERTGRYYTTQLDSNVFWAYVFWYYGNKEAIDPSDTNKPVPGVYAWASHDFLYNRYGDSEIDAHTYIHEVGHILGLDDYYDYGGKKAPLGYIDMMDGTIGDHNPFSKFALGWIDPIVVIGDSDITLRPFHSSGDVILINNNWNNTPFDEYIMIEYYTPGGLNYMDAFYPNNPFSNVLMGFSEPGIRLLHVDARLVRSAYYLDDGVRTLNVRETKYVDEIEAPSTAIAGRNQTPHRYFTEVAHSNTIDPFNPRSVVNEHYSLIEIVKADQGKPNRTPTLFDQLFGDPSNKYVATNDSLYKEGSAFKLLNFNSGESIGYAVKIGSLTEEGAKIQIRSY